jgi:hypothetical protein
MPVSRDLIGREREQEILQACLDSRRSEFVAVYGRRRVGKTFLVKELFGKDFAFYATGILGGSKTVQLENFNQEIASFGGSDLQPAADWPAAFSNLNQLLSRIQRPGKKIVFLDEIPWMSTHRSGFLSALDHFWNRWAAASKDVLLIICGSAASWVIDNVVDNTGGLHNRLTQIINLQPFTLRECEAYCVEYGILLPRYQIAEAYMIFGGIPHYLSLMSPKHSLPQNVDRMYFEPGAQLANEYQNVFRSLFKHPQNHIRVVEALGSKAKGMNREELIQASGVPEGGGLTKVLKELESSGFVREYLAYGKRRRDKLYQLIDPFTLFHLRFNQKQQVFSSDFWMQYHKTPAHNSWVGAAFERLCLLHVEQLRRALGISGVLTEVFSWQSQGSQPKAQIDLVLDRSDGIINLCEMKYSSSEYIIDKAEDQALRNRCAAFLAETRTNKALQTTIISSYGLKRNSYSMAVPYQLTIDDLFT